MATTIALVFPAIGFLGAFPSLVPSASAEETQSVTLKFAAQVGNQPFRCGQAYTLGKSASKMVVSDFRLYVSEIALIDAKGNAVPLQLNQDGQWQHDRIALLDFEDKSASFSNGTTEMRDRIVGTVPKGNYSGVRFVVGVPFGQNHEDATLAASPLNLTSLWWNWQAGYKFMRLDLMPAQVAHSGSKPHGKLHQDKSQDKSEWISHSHGKHSEDEHSDGKHSDGKHPSSTPKAAPGHGTGFPIHLGSTGCQLSSGQPISAAQQKPDRCAYPNRATITLTKLDPTQDTIVIDIAALVAGANVATNYPKTPPGCMSAPDDRDCISVMNALGIPFMGMKPTNQKFFRIRSK